MTDEDKGLRERVAKGGEEAFGRLAQELLENPMVTGALSAVFETRERATRAQEVAMSALNLPSATDLERLTRRLRAVSQRLEALEDGIDGLQDRLSQFDSLKDVDRRLAAIEASLGRIEAGLGNAGAPVTSKPARSGSGKSAGTSKGAGRQPKAEA